MNRSNTHSSLDDSAMSNFIPPDRHRPRLVSVHPRVFLKIRTKRRHKSTRTLIIRSWTVRNLFSNARHDADRRPGIHRRSICSIHRDQIRARNGHHAILDRN